MSKLKRVGIMTLYLNYNYGALLQAYALRKTIENFGYEAEDIRYYREIDGKSTYQNIKVSYIKRVFRLIKHPNLIFKLIEKRLKKSKYKNISDKVEIRKSYFNNFIAREIQESKQIYDGHKNIAEVEKFYDIFVCGSDNIWNKNMFDTSFMLDFVPQNKLKVAYAPGMSTNSLSEKQIKLVKPALDNIHYLSCREQMGAKVVSDITNRQVEVVLDPTLLISSDKWDNLIKKPSINLPDKYIFCYFCGQNKFARDIVKEFAEKNKLPIVTFPHMTGNYEKCDEKFADINIYDAGPNEFLYLIKNSSYVMTDSFHGCIFSIHYEKKFLCFHRFFDPKTAFLNNRMDNLLKLLEINSNRIIKNQEKIDISSFINADINYKNVKQTLDIKVENSLLYLKNALSDQDNKKGN